MGKHTRGTRGEQRIAECHQLPVPREQPGAARPGRIAEHDGGRRQVGNVEALDQQRAGLARSLEDLERQGAQDPVGDHDQVPEVRTPQLVDAREEPLPEDLGRAPPRVARARGQLPREGGYLRERRRRRGDAHDPGGLARDPHHGCGPGGDPVLQEQRASVEPRLHRGQGGRRGALRLRARLQPVLESARAAALQQVEDLRGVRPLGEQLDERVVDVPLVGQEVRLEDRKLQLGADRFDAGDGLAELRCGQLVLPFLPGDAAEPEEGLPAFLRGAQLGRRGQRRLEVAGRRFHLAEPEQRLAAVEVHLHRLPPVAALLRKRQRARESVERGRGVVQVEGLHDPDVLEHADFPVEVPLAGEEVFGGLVRLQGLERVF